MGHRSFGKKSQRAEEQIPQKGRHTETEGSSASSTSSVQCKKIKQEQAHDYIRTPNPNARDYLEEMAPLNGVKDLSEEQMAAVQAQRDAFRDQISKRMGDLLLRGVTMLDAYCQTCNGILMESREGVRSCVACDLYREHQAANSANQRNTTTPGSRIVSEIPLDHSHMANDHLQPAVPQRTRIPSEASATDDIADAPAPARQPVRMVDIPRGSWIQQADRMQKEQSEDERRRAESKKLRTNTAEKLSGVVNAAKAIDAKLKWAAEELELTDDLDKIRQLVLVIKESAETLKVLQK